MRLKVLYMCGDITRIGGIEKYNSDFIAALRLAELDVRVVQRHVGGLASKIKFVLEAIIALVFYRPNYVICGHLYFSPIPLFANILLGVRYSLSFYGIEAININRSIYRKAVLCADQIIVISEYTKELVARQFQLQSEKFFMLISSVDEQHCYLLPERKSLKSKYGLEDVPVVLTLSRLSSGEEKGQHRVLAAMPEILKQYPNAKYVVAGPGNDERIDKVLSAYPGLEHSLVRIGAVTEKQKIELYNLCDVFILPSKNEGFGIVFIEALACGARVIASDAYGCREALRDGILGGLVDPDDSSSISREILSVLGRALLDNEHERVTLRQDSLNIYGYRVWCKAVKNFAKRVGAK